MGAGSGGLSKEACGRFMRSHCATVDALNHDGSHREYCLGFGPLGMTSPKLLLEISMQELEVWRADDVVMCMMGRSTRWKGKICVVWSLCSGQDINHNLNSSQEEMRSTNAAVPEGRIRIESVILVVRKIDEITYVHILKAPTFDHSAESHRSCIWLGTLSPQQHPICYCESSYSIFSCDHSNSYTLSFLKSSYSCCVRRRTAERAPRLDSSRAIATYPLLSAISRSEPKNTPHGPVANS